MAERLRLAMLKAEIVAARARLVVTTSGGVAQWDAGVASASELLKQADAALYAAKEAGKNCICVATA
jgi:diguanylate cyclase (GGDEF)-like protein